MATAAQLEKPLINIALMRAHLIVGFVFLTVSMLAGILYALQFNNLYPFPGIELFSLGRIRMIHTNGVAFGFIVNVFVGALYWVVPRLAQRQVFSDQLGWLIFWVYLFIVLWAVVGMLTGHGQAVEWGRHPMRSAPMAVGFFPLIRWLWLG